MSDEKVRELEARLFVNERLLDQLLKIVALSSGIKETVENAFPQTLDAIIEASTEIGDETLKAAAEKRKEAYRHLDEPSDG